MEYPPPPIIDAATDEELTHLIGRFTQLRVMLACDMLVMLVTQQERQTELDPKYQAFAMARDSLAGIISQLEGMRHTPSQDRQAFMEAIFDDSAIQTLTYLDQPGVIRSSPKRWMLN